LNVVLPFGIWHFWHNTPPAYGWNRKYGLPLIHYYLALLATPSTFTHSYLHRSKRQPLTPTSPREHHPAGILSSTAAFFR
jgi:hypothetical protein